MCTRWWGVWLAVALAAGCLGKGANECGDITCPVDKVCVESSGCALPEQVAACNDQSDGTPCSFAGTTGKCAHGVCIGTLCGNGVVDPGEVCDWADPTNGNRCRTDCLHLATCGDHVIDSYAGEQCDDGNTTSGDGCSATCQIEACGNGILDPGEVCDDGNNASGDGCSADCKSLETCGNGYVDVTKGEQCDDGAANSDAPDALCRPDCRFRRCGDGIIDPGAGEQCEAGQLGTRTCLDFGFYDAPGLACGPTCAFDTSACAGYCGDRVVNGSEVCDGQAPAASCVDFGYEHGTISCLSLCAPDFSACESLVTTPWTLDVSGTTVALSSAWASGDNDIYAVGAQGTVLHFDGTSWSTEPSGTTQPLSAVWGSGPSDVFVVGGAGTILHRSGASWTVMTSGTTQYLTAVWGTGPTNVYVAGLSGTLLHYDGASWSAISTGTSLHLRGVWGSSATDVFVVGESSVVLHYDGTRWTLSTAGYLTNLLGVWGSGPRDVFAAGESGGLHYDGTTWSPSAPSGTGGFDILVTGPITGTGPHDVFVPSLRYDGASWTTMRSPGFTVNGMFTIGPGDVIAVGAGGGIARFRFANWSLWPTNTTSSLTAVAGNGPSDMYATGLDASNSIWHFDGNTWRASAAGTAYEVAFSSIWVGGTTIFAVGWDTTADLAVVVTCVSGSCVPLIEQDFYTTTYYAPLEGVWASSPTDVFAVGDGGTILHFDGATWVQMASEAAGDLFGVWGSAANDVFAVGNAGIVHFDGTSWSPTAVTAPLVSIAGSARDNVFAVGGGGAMFHFDGTSWTRVASGTTSPLRGVWTDGPDDAFAVTAFVDAFWFTGSASPRGIVHYDGLTTAPMRNDQNITVYALSGTGRMLYAVGELGHALRLGRSCAASETSCGNGEDDDCDGLYDCSDPDCTGDATCVAGGLCAGATSISCGSTLTGTTTTGAKRIERYACDAWLEDGREAYYRFDATTTGQVTVALTGMTTDLDLIVLATGSGRGCEPRLPGCIATSSTTGPETVSFSAIAGRTYYIVVDGFAASEGSFTLGVTCP
jgi:cysteine-rich repeat protein